jgi:hypothetical protein
VNGRPLPFAVPDGYTIDYAGMAMLDAARELMAGTDLSLEVALHKIEMLARSCPHLSHAQIVMNYRIGAGLQAPSGSVQGDDDAGAVEFCALLAEPVATLSAAAGAVDSFSGIAYSGGVVPDFGISGDMAIDLRAMRVPAGEVSVLRNHDAAQVVGRALVTNTGTQLVIEHGRFSSVTPAGREIAGLMGEGHPWKLSVGVSGRRLMTDARVPTAINGRTLNLDTIMRPSRLLEVSFVHAGADPESHASRLSARYR